MSTPRQPSPHPRKPGARKPSPRPPVDVGVVNADAALFDALAGGRAVPPDDQLAAMLAAWRDDLGTGLSPATTVDDPVVAPAVPIKVIHLHTTGTQSAPRNGRPKPAAMPKPASWQRGTLRLVAAAAVVIAFLSGLSLAAGTAKPGSPLWPVARVVYPDRSQVRAVEDLLDQARAAAAKGQYSQAERLLDRAAGQIVELNDRDAARRLIAELNQIRASLPTITPPGVPVPGSSTVPGGRTGISPGPQPGGGPNPAPTQGGGGILPSPPGLPLPSVQLPVPLPTLPLIG